MGYTKEAIKLAIIGAIVFHIGRRITPEDWEIYFYIAFPIAITIVTYERLSEVYKNGKKATKTRNQNNAQQRAKKDRNKTANAKSTGNKTTTKTQRNQRSTRKHKQSDIE